MLRVHNLLVSLDGYATGDGQSLDAAFGHAQDEFLHWFGRIRNWRGLQPDANLGPDEAGCPARQVHGQVTAPGMPDHVRAVGSGGIQDSFRVRYVPSDVERPACRGRRQAALLLPDYPEGTFELGRQRRGVIGQAGPAVQDQHGRPVPRQMVPVPSTSGAAISAFERPPATRIRTSRSRGVSVSTRP